jgi:glycosyltransferase involved in cell wall biosynthesis
LDEILPASANPSLAIYLPDLSGGGAERLHLRLAPLFMKAGYDVTFLLDREGGELMPYVPEGCRIVVLNAKRQISALPKLVKYLSSNPPDFFIANMEHMNVMAVLARLIARAKTKIIVTQHNAFSEQIKRRSWKFRVLPTLYRRILPLADAIVTVSAGVADDLAAVSGLRRETMTVIYNGVVASDFQTRADEPAGHRWFSETTPVIVGMGRFVPQKDFPTLIDGFAAVADRTDARLLILGDGPLRAEMENQIAAHGLGDRIEMPGFVENPLPYLKNAALFVLSSRFEGFGNVVAEALACGTPVVSTDCPHGPAEILEHGRYGGLVPVSDAAALGQALLHALAEPKNPAMLAERGRVFSAENCANGYRSLIDGLHEGVAVSAPLKAAAE